MAPLTPKATAELSRLLAGMSLDDATRVHAILEAPDQMTVAALIHAYMRDLDRAERTPRGILYLFFGFQQAIIETLVAARTVH